MAETRGSTALKPAQVKLCGEQKISLANTLLWSQIKKVLALTADGKLLLLHLNSSKFKLIDSTKISDAPTWAHLAVCGKVLFIRELNGLTKLNWNP
ncbi:MAG TPA: hypothetical protein EYG40_12885 [Verrucomicrobia bacterium]|nr:hypothetical protein [Verrucomicrobiales bacterium]HIL55914.1 hypothetical protein [Verrucomicrobiota bacterium]